MRESPHRTNHALSGVGFNKTERKEYFMAEKQSNKERIKEITAGIEKGIQELFESDRYRNYLTTMSRFHRYSLNNVMLIHAQKPDATLVAGFNKWKNSFGRHVKKGEKGFRYWLPPPIR